MRIQKKDRWPRASWLVIVTCVMFSLSCQNGDTYLFEPYLFNRTLPQTILHSGITSKEQLKQTMFIWEM